MMELKYFEGESGGERNKKEFWISFGSYKRRGEKNYGFGWRIHKLYWTQYLNFLHDSKAQEGSLQNYSDSINSE